MFTPAGLEWKGEISVSSEGYPVGVSRLKCECRDKRRFKDRVGTPWCKVCKSTGVIVRHIPLFDTQEETYLPSADVDPEYDLSSEFESLRSRRIVLECSLHSCEKSGEDNYKLCLLTRTGKMCYLYSRKPIGKRGIQVIVEADPQECSENVFLLGAPRLVMVRADLERSNRERL